MSELVKVVEIFKTLENTPSRNDKIDIIQANADNKLFISMLDFLYNDYIRTGLAISKIHKVIKIENEVTIDNVVDMMEYLKENNTGSDVMIANTQAYLNTIDDGAIREFLIKVFTKTYKCGVTAKLVNKALGKMVIPEFSCQLAYLYQRYESKIDGEFFITKKFDGNRMLAFYSDGKVVFRTRKGHVVDGLVELEPAVEAFAIATGKSDFVLDGEIMMINHDNLPSDELFKATSRILRSKGDKRDLEFYVFDLLTIAEFQRGQSDKPYYARREEMDELFSLVHSDLLIKVDVLYRGSDKDEIIRWSERATANGWEGVMVNTADGLYVTKRTSNLLKAKSFYSSDVKVIDVFEAKADSKYFGLLGGIVVQFKDFTVNVGSGFSESERKEFWEDKSKIIGKIVEIQYFDESCNQNGGKSLRFPTFKGIRYDKTEDDISYES